jgi:hypothetical protein
MMTERNRFYCNIAALSALERANHQKLTDKLADARKHAIETEQGYEFQFQPL